MRRPAAWRSLVELPGQTSRAKDHRRLAPHSGSGACSASVWLHTDLGLLRREGGSSIGSASDGCTAWMDCSSTCRCADENISPSTVDRLPCRVVRTSDGVWILCMIPWPTDGRFGSSRSWIMSRHSPLLEAGVSDDGETVGQVLDRVPGHPSGAPPRSRWIMGQNSTRVPWRLGLSARRPTRLHTTRANPWKMRVLNRVTGGSVMSA